MLGVADGALTHRPATGDPHPAPVLPPDTSRLLTTSGSTGTPKLVPLGGPGIDAFTTWAGNAFALGAAARVFNFAPLNFDLALLDVWTTLRHGGCVVSGPGHHSQCVLGG
ncbi:AMP-binding protein [Micromonospora sp. R77]|uniref:AMP-binding protein n=1 Tax=Micromonospora sp. R77 TaxID=2925836 RepID=UPI001F622E00|nr:AMP-binding protein [Micromonospora sp. R77]MCI4061681.1 AMP-binding protein [Micromonospora sp. R77]